MHAGELEEASLAYAAGAQNDPTHDGLQAEAQRAAAFPLPPPSANQIAHERFGAPPTPPSAVLSAHERFGAPPTPPSAGLSAHERFGAPPTPRHGASAPSAVLSAHERALLFDAAFDAIELPEGSYGAQAASADLQVIASNCLCGLAGDCL